MDNKSWQPYQSSDAPKGEPTPRPKICPKCKEKKYLVWTYCPYAYEIQKEYKFEWICKECHDESCNDI